MAYEHLIAARHLKARGKRSLSVVTWLAVIGVALGVAALVGGFSITSGFEQAFREKVLGITAHLFVREYGIRFTDYRAVQDRLAEVEGVAASSPMTFNEAMLSGATGTAGVVVKGIDPAQAGRVLALSDYMAEGSLADLEAPDPQGVEGIVLGGALAEKLGAKRGDLITVISPLRTLDPEAWRASPDAPVSRPFRVCGIFDAGFHEYDTRLAYMALPTAQRFFATGDAVAGIEVAVDDPLRAGEVAARVDAALGAGDFSVLDWRRQNRNLFASLTYQRLAILLVLSVMVVLAACNVAIMLIMLVLERTKEIAILKAMGATDRSILRVFVWEGLAIGAVGTAVGLVLAFAFCEGLLSNGLTLDPKVYGIARLPVVFEPLDYLMAAVGALVITFVAAIFPALRGARLAPVDGLRETFG
ncbi:MAG: ABC transporter permease [Myxococcales bacterium]|nr:ABC transporter permease [Myxococcales bacterium]